MKLLFHFALIGFANTYLLGPYEGGDAILVDPGTMDAELLDLIEQHGYYIKSVLITHAHDSHVRGLITLKKIYEAEIYAYSPYIYDFPTTPLRDNDSFNLNEIKIDTIEVPGHSSDSLVFQIGGMLFTGDILAAGRVGSTQNSYSRALLLRSISEKIYPLPDSTLIFPGHGPPSILKAEKMFNPDLKLLDKGTL